MVPFERVVTQLRSLYQLLQELEPEALLDPDAQKGWSPGPRWEVLSRYDELLADAGAMVGAACPPLPFTPGDRAWLEKTLAGLGLDVRAPSAR